MRCDQFTARIILVRILVAESKWTGHHLFFARSVAEALRSPDDEVILAVTASKAAAPRRMLEIATGNVTGAGVEVRRSLTGPEAGYARIGDRDGGIEVDTISAEIAATRPDRVVVPSADAVGFFLGGRSTAPELLRSQATRLILHQPYVGYGGRGLRFALRREFIRHRLRKSVAGLAALDHRITRAMGPRHPVSILPNIPQTDPVVSVADARRRFGIDHDRPVFLAAGEHSQRKGTDRLVDAWPAESEGTLLIVGHCSEQVQSAVAKRPKDLDAGRIRIFDEVLDDPTHAKAFHACDVVTACYQQHFGVSGILHTAAQIERPILGSDYGYIGDCIRAFGLGSTVDCRDSDALAAALREGLRLPPTMDSIRSLPFREFHSAESFRGHLRMWALGTNGIDPPPAPIP